MIAIMDGLELLKERLGNSFFSIVQVILTDRGSEFCDSESIESLSFRVFYCNSMCSCKSQMLNTIT